MSFKMAIEIKISLSILLVLTTERGAFIAARVPRFPRATPLSRSFCEHTAWVVIKCETLSRYTQCISHRAGGVSAILDILSH